MALYLRRVRGEAMVVRKEGGYLYEDHMLCVNTEKVAG
jgi:hypothetical protein